MKPRRDAGPPRRDAFGRALIWFVVLIAGVAYADPITPVTPVAPVAPVAKP